MGIEDCGYRFWNGRLQLRLDVDSITGCEIAATLSGSSELVCWSMWVYAGA